MAQFQRRCRSKHKVVTDIVDEHRETLQRMIPVAALLADMQEQIDLRRREDADATFHGPPICSFFSIFVFSSGFGAEGERVVPLEAGVELAAYLPERVAIVVVDRRIARHEQDGVLQQSLPRRQKRPSR